MRPPGRVTRAISRTTARGSATCRMTVMASAASKRSAPNARCGPPGWRAVPRRPPGVGAGDARRGPGPGEAPGGVEDRPARIHADGLTAAAHQRGDVTEHD